MSAGLLARLTFDPERCGGRPCIRGVRIRVTDVLDLLATGLTAAQILEELPDLEPADVEAALRFASRQIDHERAALHSAIDESLREAAAGRSAPAEEMLERLRSRRR